MPTPLRLLSTLLILSIVPGARAASGEAATWTPPPSVRVAASTADAGPTPANPETDTSRIIGPAEAATWTPPPFVRVPAPAAAEAPSPVITEPEAPAKPRTRRVAFKSKRCKQGKPGCKSGRAPGAATPPVVEEVSPQRARLLAAGAQRDRLLEVARPMTTAGHSDDVARMLARAAEVHADPVLYVAAAEAELVGPGVDGDQAARAIRLTREAKRVIPSAIDQRITSEEASDLGVQAQQLSTFATRRQTQLRLLQRGKAEFACGTTFLVLGGVGVGMLVSGAILSLRVKASQDSYQGQDADYLAALEAGKGRAGALVAAGLVSGILGTVVGIPLTVAGMRDRKRARSSSPERPSFRFSPGIASLAVAGRF